MGPLGGLARVLLRPWGAPPGDVEHDAAALAAAWADPAVARGAAVPVRRDRAAAARWIAGEPERRARRVAFDLVVGSPDDRGRAVLGEVGLTRLDAAGRAEIGFWLARSARGRGLATAAVALTIRWALAPGAPAAQPVRGPGGPGHGAGGLGLRRVWARTAVGAARAGAVLVRAGFARRGEASGYVVWTLDAASLRS